MSCSSPPETETSRRCHIKPTTPPDGDTTTAAKWPMKLAKESRKRHISLGRATDTPVRMWLLCWKRRCKFCSWWAAPQSGRCGPGLVDHREQTATYGNGNTLRGPAKENLKDHLTVVSCHFLRWSLCVGTAKTHVVTSTTPPSNHRNISTSDTCIAGNRQNIWSLRGSNSRPWRY